MTEEKERKTEYIQIIGTQRSGSNLLRLMLNELDEVIAPHPPHILSTFMPLVAQYPDLSRDSSLKMLIDDVCVLIETNPVVWDHIKFDRDMIFSRCRGHSLIEVFRVVYVLMAEANKAKFWCCKSMANVNYYKQIESSRLRPYYIHLIRDGRDVASSFRKIAVGEKHIFHLAQKWKIDQQISERLVSEVGKYRAMAIKYEDFIINPENVIKSICSLIGIPYSDKILNFFKSTEGKHTASAGFMWKNLTKPILKNNIQKFKNELTPGEIKLFEHVAGDVLMSNGYRHMFDENDMKITSVMKQVFEKENIRLKNETRKKDHLKLDICKRKHQEEFISLIKNKLSSKVSMI